MTAFVALVAICAGLTWWLRAADRRADEDRALTERIRRNLRSDQ